MALQVAVVMKVAGKILVNRNGTGIGCGSLPIIESASIDDMKIIGLAIGRCAEKSHCPQGDFIYIPATTTLFLASRLALSLTAC